MNIGNFKCRLADAVTELTISPERIKYRLQNAILNHLLLANVPVCYEVPEYFRSELESILLKVSTKNRGGRDAVRASLDGKHGKTLSLIAMNILQLHRDYEEYLRSGFIPRLRT